MNEIRLHYAPVINRQDNKYIRLRNLKYVNSLNHNPTDLRLKKLGNRNNLGFKKEFHSLKFANKLQVSQSQTAHPSSFNHLYRLTKSVRKLSFLQVYGPLFMNSNEKEAKSLLLMQTKNLRSLRFSYEIQDPNFSDYESFYEFILALNGNAAIKSDNKGFSDNFYETLQNLNVVLPKDLVFVVDFRVSNEILDYPPIDRLTLDSESYLWSLAASYFTLSDVEGPFAYKFDSLWNIKKIFLSCHSSNASFASFQNFLSQLAHINTIHVQLKKAIHDQVIFFKDVVSVFRPMSKLTEIKNLIIDCENIAFDPSEFSDIVFPQNLTSLQLTLKNLQIKNLESSTYFEQFATKLAPLSNLKELKLELPIECFTNQLIHKIPSTLQSLENLHLYFPEASKEDTYQDIYINSLLECVCTMPNLKIFYLRTSKLNYTYNAFLSAMSMPSGLRRLQWIEDTLHCSNNVKKEITTKQWIECKKFEDLNIIMKLLSIDLEYLEIPLVFDGLESEFVALRFMEILPTLIHLKKLNIAFGFKALDESHIEVIDTFIANVKSVFADKYDFQMNLDIYYRKIKGSFDVEQLSLQTNNVRKKRICNIRYIHDLKQ